MISPDLIAYARRERLAGVSPDAIIKAVVERGWTPREARAAIAASIALPPIPHRESGSVWSKWLLSVGVLAASFAYAFVQSNGSSGTTGTTDPAAPISINFGDDNPAVGVKTSNPASTPAPGVPVSTPVPVPVTQPATPPPKKNGKFADGTYTGSAADAYYGIIQVQAVVQNGALTDVKFLQYPNDRSTSREISAQAMPLLKNEAIKAQSANVDIISGATDTSMAFNESLGNALAKAQP